MTNPYGKHERKIEEREKNEENVITATYDNILKDIVPKLTTETVDRAVESVNTLVRLQRPSMWECSPTPRVMLGITSDKATVVYGGATRLGFYYAVPFDKLYTEALSRVDHAQQDYEKDKQTKETGKDEISAPERFSCANRCEVSLSILANAKSLLESLVSLKQK